VRDTLYFSESTLYIRPKAAATKNKMRMAENAFILFIGIIIILGRFYMINFIKLDNGLSVSSFNLHFNLSGRRDCLGGCKNNQR
jgi:hypothetical protein